MDQNTIIKSGGILIKNRMIMLERHGNNDVFIIPGGKLEDNESIQEALVRELMEEFRITVSPDHLDELGIFESQAVHSPSKKVRLSAFLVKEWSGNITLNDGIQEIIWINSKNSGDYKISPIAKEILPLLQEKRLID